MHTAQPFLSCSHSLRPERLTGLLWSHLHRLFRIDLVVQDVVVGCGGAAEDKPLKAPFDGSGGPDNGG
jgi:hypothetical protein